MTLTDLKIRAAQPKSKPYHLTDGHGLFLPYRLRQKASALKHKADALLREADALLVEAERLEASSSLKQPNAKPIQAALSQEHTAPA
jgi:hypothetical protein